MNDKDPEQGTRHRRGWVSAVATVATFAALVIVVAVVAFTHRNSGERDPHH
jgi:hypothetical protein